MEKNKKDKSKDVIKEDVTKGVTEGTIEKSWWLIGIALIIFLILVLGSVIGLKMVRDKSNDVANSIGNKINGGSNQANYVVLEDGTKENVNKDIANAEFTIEGRKISNFAIKEKNGLSNVSVTLENVTNAKLPGATFVVKIIDSKDTVIKEYRILTTELEPATPITTVTSIVEDCSDASRVEVELVGVSQSTQEPGSGD